MPADDSIKPAVVNALRKDGWTITDDPLTVEVAGLYLFIDLAGERAAAAGHGADRIAVEVKSFPHKSMVADLQQAVGQFVMYRSFLRRVDPERALVLAVSQGTYERVFAGEPVAGFREELNMPLVV